MNWMGMPTHCDNKMNLFVVENLVMGSDVDKLSEILTKTSNTVEFIESDIQNIEHQEQMILSSN